MIFRWPKKSFDSSSHRRHHLLFFSLLSFSMLRNDCAVLTKVSICFAAAGEVTRFTAHWVYPRLPTNHRVKNTKRINPDYPMFHVVLHKSGITHFLFLDSFISFVWIPIFFSLWKNSLWRMLGWFTAMNSI